MPDQVFNMDEKGLFWKKMPSHNFIMRDKAKAPGFKILKDCITLIMCANAAGFIIKPGLIYKSKNQRPESQKILTSDWFH